MIDTGHGALESTQEIDRHFLPHAFLLTRCGNDDSQESNLGTEHHDAGSPRRCMRCFVPLFSQVAESYQIA